MSIIPREVRDMFDRDAIYREIAERLYGPPVEREYYAIEVRVRPVDADGRPDPGAETVRVAGVGSFEPDDDAMLPPAASGGAIVAVVESPDRFAHRIEWRPNSDDGVAFRATLEPPAVTLSAEQVAELRRLVGVDVIDEWHAEALYDELSDAVLRMIGGGA